MTFRFQTCRKILCVIVMFLSITSIVLAAYLSPFLTHHAIIWMLGLIQFSSFLRALLSIISKLLFKRPQSVASEVIGLFVLFPFQLILTLVMVTVVIRQESAYWTVIILQGVTALGASIHILYTTCLIFTTLLTVVAFDKKVWSRDIESSPSPFPMPILFAFAFPCLVHRSPVSFPATTGSMTPRLARMCLAGCTCTTKPQHSPPPTSLSHMTPALPLSQPRREGTLNHKSSNSLPQSLVRIPDAAERRSSIPVTLHFR